MTNNDAFVWTWNHISQLGHIIMCCSTHLCFINSQTTWHFGVHKNCFIFLMNLLIGAIMNVKFLMKHLLNWAIPLNTYICFGFVGTCIWIMVWIFLIYNNFPSLDNINQCWAGITILWYLPVIVFTKWFTKRFGFHFFFKC